MKPRKRHAPSSKATMSPNAKRMRVLSERQPKPGLLMEHTATMVLSFLADFEDVCVTSLVCKKLWRISSSVRARANTRFVRPYWGRNPDLARAEKILSPFVAAGNLEAMRFLGMIMYYCKADMRTGMSLLLKASSAGNLEATYDAALILRKHKTEEAKQMFAFAASKGHLPSCLELCADRAHKVIEERNIALDVLFEQRQRGVCFRFIRDYWDEKGRGSLRCWCSSGCGRHRLTSADRRRLLSDDPHCPRMILRKCARCLDAKYCSRFCQVVSWKSGHRSRCVRPALRELVDVFAVEAPWVHGGGILSIFPAPTA
ncbi:hypothetical protein AAMO2058_001272100 [Amorphochlora amoebiformis]